MSTLTTCILVAGYVVILIYLAKLYWRESHVMNVRSGTIVVSDDQVAVKKFLELLDEARESMIIYDHGDTRAGSIYSDQEVTEAVWRKLFSNPGFSIRCLFDFDEPGLPFRRALEHRSSRVQIRAPVPQRDKLAYHYKIIDNGSKGYLSRNRAGQTAKRIRVVDCTEIPIAHRCRVSDVALRRFKKHFRRTFPTDKA